MSKLERLSDESSFLFPVVRDNITKVPTYSNSQGKKKNKSSPVTIFYSIGFKRKERGWV